MKILVAEADANTRGFLERTLNEWGYEFAIVSAEAAAWELLEKSDAPWVVILGSLKEEQGRVELCRKIRKRREQPYTYVLLLASKERGEDIVEAMESGADDYLIQPFGAYVLKVHIRSGKRILDLKDELRRAKETIGYQLHHDSLTGLWNRTAIMDILRRELARSERQGTSVAVIMAAVDGLKSINDSYSHAVGDHVIRITARRLRSSLRPYDALGRYNGGIFLIVVPGCNARSAMKQAERLQAGISARPIEIPPWGKFSSTQAGTMAVTVSLGMIVGTAENELEDLLRAAEQAANQARSLGVSQIEQGTIPPEEPGSTDMG